MRRDRGQDQTTPVWGTDLVCPVAPRVVSRIHRHALAHPWRGDTTLTCPAHKLTTTAITDPGRPIMVIYSLDYMYHMSGWFANSDYESCLHLSLSHPRPDVARLWVPPEHLGVARINGFDVETPTDAEARAWARVFWREHARKAWFEPAVGPGDPYRLPGIVHLRLFLDQQGRPFVPRGEVYTLKPFDDGSSPKKITDGRAGADVR